MERNCLRGIFHSRVHVDCLARFGEILIDAAILEFFFFVVSPAGSFGDPKRRMIHDDMEGTILLYDPRCFSEYFLHLLDILYGEDNDRFMKIPVRKCREVFCASDTVSDSRSIFLLRLTSLPASSLLFISAASGFSIGPSPIRKWVICSRISGPPSFGTSSPSRPT